MTDVQPKYYATNTKALTLGECLRMGGGAFGVWVWFLTRFSAPMEDKQLLPVLYDSIEARLEDFSDEMRVRVEEVTATICGARLPADRLPTVSGRPG
jgi:hypothetical protein